MRLKLIDFLTEDVFQPNWSTFWAHCKANRTWNLLSRNINVINFVSFNLDCFQVGLFGFSQFLLSKKIIYFAPIFIHVIRTIKSRTILPDPNETHPDGENSLDVSGCDKPIVQTDLHLQVSML